MDRNVLQGSAETPIPEVIRRMNSQQQSAFVVCEAGEPVGMITERDAVIVLASAFSGESFSTTVAGDIMTRPVYTLHESDFMSEVIRMMKKHGFRRVPITDDKNRLSGIINFAEVQIAMNQALERRGRDLEVAVMARTAELLAANAKLEKLSLHDSLTGLLNRRAMSQKLDELHALARRYGNPYAVILCDIDEFKLYNDSQGHLAGDEAIKRITRTMQEAVRVSDSVYRYGGEEFLVVLQESTASNAARVAERIRSMVEELQIPHPAGRTSQIVTISLGYTDVGSRTDASEHKWDHVIERADRALYQAKQQGRNRAIGWHETEHHGA